VDRRTAGVRSCTTVGWQLARIRRCAADPAAVDPPIALNRAYFDESSADFFAQRTIKVRGAREDGAIVARTLWPEDFSLDSTPPWHALDRNVPRTEALRALVRAEPRGGAQSPFATFTLWQRKDASAGHPSHPDVRSSVFCSTVRRAMTMKRTPVILR
jgi:hypothetical protein